jgi:hypothetical protein
MKSMPTFASKTLLFGGWILLLSRTFIFPACLAAQNAGNNAVYDGTTSTPMGSNSFVDVSAFSPSGDLCARINNAFLHAVPVGRPGTVLDARGITGSGQACAGSPFDNPMKQATRSVTILLPAATIIVHKAWAIPDQTQVVGEGPGRTILQAASDFSDPLSPAAMLHMGTPSQSGMGGGIVFEVRIQHLTLDGQGKSIGVTPIDGIDNLNAEEQSYVDDVSITNINGNGLFLGTDANGATKGTSNHSGPYSNILFQTSSAPTACVNILNAEPRGLHGITCIANADVSNAAILLDGNNVSLDNIRIDGFHDGILIGSRQAVDFPPESDLLLNITGTATVSATTNLVHISNAHIGINGPNFSIMGVTSVGVNTIVDDVTGTTLSTSADPNVGMYVLGQVVGGSGYSRFSTSPRIPTWGSGSSAPSGACPSNGSLFSVSTASASPILWACVNNGTSTSWTAVK